MNVRLRLLRFRNVPFFLFALLTLSLGCSQRNLETINSSSDTIPNFGSDSSTQIQLSITQINPVSTISFCVPVASNTLCEVRNVVGYHVKTIWSGPVEAGCASAYWDGTNENGESVRDGIYNVYLLVGTLYATKKLIVDRDDDGKF